MKSDPAPRIALKLAEFLEVDPRCVTMDELNMQRAQYPIYSTMGQTMLEQGPLEISFKGRIAFQDYKKNQKLFSNEAKELWELGISITRVSTSAVSADHSVTTYFEGVCSNEFKDENAIWGKGKKEIVL